MNLRLFFLILLVGALSFFQAWGFSIFALKPNLALVIVIAASFFIADLWEGLLLIALAALILKFAPGFEKEILIFSLITAAALAVKSYLPWRYFLSNPFLIFFGTAGFYLFLAPNLIASTLFLKELVLNLIFGALMFALLSFLRQNRII